MFRCQQLARRPALLMATPSVIRELVIIDLGNFYPFARLQSADDIAIWIVTDGGVVGDDHPHLSGRRWRGNGGGGGAGGDAAGKGGKCEYGNPC